MPRVILMPPSLAKTCGYSALMINLKTTRALKQRLLQHKSMNKTGFSRLERAGHDDI